MAGVLFYFHPLSAIYPSSPHTHEPNPFPSGIPLLLSLRLHLLLQIDPIYLVSGRLEIDVSSLVGQCALESHEEHSFIVVLGSRQRFAHFIVVARMRELVHALSH